MTNAYKILVGKPEEKRPLGRHRCRIRVILILVSKEQVVRCRLNSSGSEQEPVTDSCERTKLQRYVCNGDTF